MTDFATQDLVGVYDSSFNQLFEDARPIRCVVNERSRLMEHPIETGATIADHVVVLPTEIELSLIPRPDNFVDSYNAIKAQYQSQSFVSVQTKTDTYTNMLIMEMPHDERPETFDTVAISLKLREAILVAAQFSQLPPSAVKNKSRASTVQSGQKQPEDAPQSLLSQAYDFFTKAP